MNVADIIAFITNRRKELGLSQSDIGNKIGYSSQLVFNWEKGKSLPDLATISELCKVLDISISDFFNCTVSSGLKEEIKPFNIDEFSRCLKKIRNENNLTQQGFAKKIGVSFPTVIAWEKGKSTPSIKDFLVICETYKLNPSEFYYGRIKENKNPNKKSKNKKKIIFPLLLTAGVVASIVVPVSIALNKTNDGNSISESLNRSSIIISSSKISKDDDSSTKEENSPSVSSEEISSSEIASSSSVSSEPISSSSELVSSSDPSSEPISSSPEPESSSSVSSEPINSSSSESLNSSSPSSEPISSSSESESSSTPSNEPISSSFEPSSSSDSPSSEPISSSSEPISSSTPSNEPISSSMPDSSSTPSSEPISSSMPDSSSSSLDSSSVMPIRRKITFLSDDKKTVLHTLYFDDNERVNEINYIPIKEAESKIYIFKGWDLDDDMVPDKINIIMDRDYVFVAVFEEVDKVTTDAQYTVERIDVNKVKIVSCVDTKGKSEITLPNYIGTDRVVEVGESIFNKDSSITKITIPQGIEIFDRSCFKSLSGLKEVIFPPSIDNVGRNAFYNDNALEKVVMPVEYCVFGASCFGNCSSLTSVDVSCLDMLNTRIFENCSNLESLTGLDNIKTISASAFSGSKIKSLVFSAKDITVFDNAFDNMSELTYLEFSNSIYSLGNNEFVNCNKLDTIVYPKKISNWYASKKSISEDCKTIYYKGSLEDFSLLKFQGEYKYGLYDNVNVYCYSETEAPQCWRYVDNVPTKY